MSKRSITKKLSKALAIVIIASMTFQPVAVLAEETVEPVKAVIESNAPTSTVEQVDEANKEYVEQVNAAGSEVANVADDVQKVKDVQQAVDDASDYANEGDTTKPSLADADEIDQTYGELVDAEKKVDDDKKTVDGDVKNIDAKSDEASTAVSKLETATGDVDKLAKDVNDAVKTTDAVLSETDIGIKGAKNDKEATDFYEKAKTAVEETDKKLEQAATDYKEKEAAYQTALKDAEKAEEEYAEAVANASADVDAAIANMNAAKEKAETLKGQAEEALKALQDAYAVEKTDLEGLEKAASETASDSEKANKDVTNKENECKDLEQTATQAAGALKTAKADKKTADDEEKTAQKEYDKVSKSFDQEKYGLSDTLSNMASNINPDNHEDEPALARELIMTYVYNMAFDGSINAKYSTINFSEWTETDELNVPYIKVSYSKKNKDQKEVRYYIYTTKDGTILIDQMKESKDSTEDVPKFQARYNVFSDEKFKAKKDDIKSKSDKYLNDNKEKKDAFDVADAKLKTATEKVGQAEKNLTAAEEADKKAQEDVTAANSQLEGLKKTAETAAEKARDAKDAYDRLAVTDGKFSIAVDTYTKLDAAAKEADKEVVDAANKLTVLQEAINGLTKRMLIADNLTESNAFTGRIAELKNAFESAKIAYDDAVAQKKNLSEKIELLKDNLDTKLAKLAEEQAAPAEGTSRPDSGTASSATVTSGAATSGETSTAAGTAGVQSVASISQTAAEPVGQVLGARNENGRPASNQAKANNTKNDISTNTETETVTETNSDTNKNVKADTSTDNKSEGNKMTEQGVNPAATIIDPVVPLAPVVPTDPENTTSSIPLILIILVIGAAGVIGFSAFEILRRARIK